MCISVLCLAYCKGSFSIGLGMACKIWCKIVHIMQAFQLCTIYLFWYSDRDLDLTIWFPCKLLVFRNLL